MAVIGADGTAVPSRQAGHLVDVVLGRSALGCAHRAFA
jgi:hypothetical protein